MKTAICTIAKLENDYLREWVEYYKELGIDHIFLYDNNDEDGEDFHDVIGDYIEGGFVTVRYWKDLLTSEQKLANMDCYLTYGKDFDYIGFFDVDEFFTLPAGMTLDEFFDSDPAFKEYAAIAVPSIEYDDNEILDYNGEPCLERFTRMSVTKYVGKQSIIFHKCFVKTGIEGLTFFKNANTPDGYNVMFDGCHTPYVFQGPQPCCCNIFGQPFEVTYAFGPIPNGYLELGIPYIKHFSTKTIIEFIRKKMKRNWPDNSSFKQFTVDDFWRNNTKTDEKLNIAKKFTETEGEK